jgi:transposase-like protein
MPRSYHLLTDEQKEEIISRIKEKGERVADLAKEYGVNIATIYRLLSHCGENPALYWNYLN